MSNIEEQIKKEPVHAIMTLIMRLCNDEQKQVVYEKLGRRVDQSPDLPTEEELKDEAEGKYKIYEAYTVSEKAVTTGLRKGYIEGRKKNIARIKELEEHLRNIYEMYGDEWTDYAQGWTEKVLRINPPNK